MKKNTVRSALLLFLVATTLGTLFSACSPARRNTRQDVRTETRVEERTEDRMDRRR